MGFFHTLEKIFFKKLEKLNILIKNYKIIDRIILKNFKRRFFEI